MAQCSNLCHVLLAVAPLLVIVAASTAHLGLQPCKCLQVVAAAQSGVAQCSNQLLAAFALLVFVAASTAPGL